LKLCLITGDPFGEKVLGNLVNMSNFCASCALACGYCRTAYPSFVSDIRGFYSLSIKPKDIIDDPVDLIPKDMPRSDLLLAIGLHPDILTILPNMVSATSVQAVIVPIEDRRWCPPNMQKQLEFELNRLNIEHAFPKPFCSLEEQSSPVIDEFIRRYKVGRPKLEIKLKGDMISEAKVLRSAPCGNTWYVAQQIRFHNIVSLNDVISKAHHGYPCTASMDIDPELNDTILHKAGYIIREEVQEAISRAKI